MHVRAALQGSEPVVNQEESNGKLPPCVHCQESDNGSLSSTRVVLDLMVLYNNQFGINYERLKTVLMTICLCSLGDATHQTNSITSGIPRIRM